MAIDETPSGQTQPIAVIGMGCRFSGDATSPSKLWDLCTGEKDAWSPIPQNRFDVNSFYDALSEKMGRSHVRGGYFMTEDVTRFDAGFFNLPADVASAMDPQIRLLLEIVYEAMEDAGLPLEKLAGSNTSVFTGLMGKDYQDIQTRDPELLTAPFVTGQFTTMVANRISHFYNLRGQSVTIDTACSSGLVALHQGCQSIWSGESATSIVGASSLMLSQDLFIAMSSLGALSEEGRCFAWDARAHGYGRGEGVAALILKPLDAAIKNGDHIHAVVRDVGINQDGKTTTITSPSMDAQIELIEACYKRAGLDMADTGYVEAHMTGTQTGDAVEAEAIATTFGRAQKAEPIQVGSVKTIVGHTEPTSGLAAFIKTVLAMKHRQIPPNRNYETTNPNIKLDEWRLQVPTHLTPWPQDKQLRASINNFGIGGTNAHVIVEGPPSSSVGTNGVNGHISHQDVTSFSSPRTNGVNGHAPHQDVTSSSPLRLNGVNGHASHKEGTQTLDRYWIHVLSASDSTSCLEMAKNLATYLRQSVQDCNEPTLSDLAYTLFERRSRLPWALAVRARNVTELAERLTQPAVKALYSTKKPRLGFVFNGQGAQWHAMGRELISAYPVFAASIQKADQILREYGANWSLQDELMRDEHKTRVAETNISQPISVALQLCLIELLRSWAILPSAVTSHSSGEIAAAYAVDALSFKEALGVVYFRGELALKHQKLSSFRGGMLAAGVGPKKVEQYIADTKIGRVVIACINSPESVTLSGDLTALDEVAARLDNDGVFARKLQVPLAYHSHQMLPMEQEYIESLRSIVPEPLPWNDNIIFASPVTGGTISGISKPEHWAQNLTNPVRFSEAFESICGTDANLDVVVEIGAHGTLAGPIRQILNGREIAYVSCLKRSTDAVETMQNLVCEVLARGYPVDLRAVNSPFNTDVPTFVSDLPAYPWNHGTQYWLESRTNKETHFKKFPPHELLGLPISGDTGPIPTWRNFLRLADLPWLADHQVESKVVLPGAAYVSMATEAIRLLTASVPSVRGYRLRDVNILNALTIPESSKGVEVHTRLSASSESDLDYRGWYNFEISSVDSAGSWVKNCEGFVSAEMEMVNKSVLFRETETPRESSFFAPSARVRDIDVNSIYETLRHMNIYHGPTFQNLAVGRAAGDRSILDISVPGVASETFDYIIHPTVLDTIVQTTFGGLPQELSQGYMLLPRSIGHMFIPHDLPRKSGSLLKAFTELRKSSKPGFMSDIDVASVESDGLSPSFLRMSDFHCQAIPLDINEASRDQQSPLCYKMRWTMDIFHQLPPAVKDSIKIFLSDTEADFEKKLLRMSYHFIFDAVETLKNDPKEGWAHHRKEYYQWMEHIVRQGSSGALIPGSKSWSRTSKGMKQILSDELESWNSCGKLTVRVGQHLVDIVRGNITPLEVMLEDDLLNQYYMEIPRLKSRTYKHVAKVAELYAIKNPGANVLEIGAGTGGATQIVLEAFGSMGDGSGSLLGHYTFTDVSTGFFPAAKQKLAAWASMVSFAELNIEVDPANQSFTPGSYDLIVASFVLHATRNLRKTMSNVRKLLKPGGKLLLIEDTKDRLDLQFIFGTLPDWWLSEEPYRKQSPNVSLEVWNDILKDTGFSGIDFDISECEERELQSGSLIWTTAKPPAPSWPSQISIVHTTTPPQFWLTSLTQRIQDKIGTIPSVESLAQLDSVQDKVCIFTAEMIAPILDGIDKDSFETLRNLLISCRGILWLSCGGTIDAADPRFAQTWGLLRTLRLEQSSSRFVQLDFEKDAETWSEDKISYVLHVLEQSFDNNVAHADVESEYAVKNSILHIPRVYPDKDEDESVDSGELVPQKVPFHQPGHDFLWEPSASRTLSNLHFVDVDMSGEPPSGMVQIEAKAFGLNFLDVMSALGQVNNMLSGHDIAGVVTKLGPQTEPSGLKIGDRVCGLSQGRFASSSYAHWTAVAKLPEEFSWEDGAAIPVVYITAYHSLVRLGGLRKGETVLIHAAAGGVGEAAIVIAQHLGAEVFGTCSTEAKRDLLVEKFGVDPARIFSSRDESFAPAIMAATGGKGVDVVINSLSETLLKATWNCMARFGRFIEIGKVDIQANRSLNMAPFGRCVTYASFDALQLSEYDGPSTHEAITESVRMCLERTRGGAGQRRPMLFPIQTFSISDLELAMRAMQSGTHSGKLVIVPHEGDHVNVISHPRPFSLASLDTTYLIAGGVGGIGRVLTSWMIQNGAKNIVLVSRNAESHAGTAELMQTSKAEGCNLLVRNCDVSSEESLTKLLEYCSSVSLPPIKGVINGAMVLDDTIMERMTFEQWQLGTRTKVNSSVNLHKLLPDLSFFVLLSSVTGVIGHVSQGNYAAGNTFQDALARNRAAAGLCGVSIDLSAVTDAGFVATQQDSTQGGNNRVQSRVEKLGTLSVDMAAVQRVLEFAIFRRSQRLDVNDAQVMFSWTPWDQLEETASTRNDRRFGTLRLTSPRGAAASMLPGTATATNSPTSMLLQALQMSPTSERTQSTAQAIAERLAVIFNVSVEQLILSVPLATHGVDSLVAVEVRNWLATSAKAKVSIFEVVRSSSILEFADLVIQRSQIVVKE